MNIGQSKEQLTKLTTEQLKKQTEKDAWISLKQYFDGAGNGTEAKVACVVVGVLAKEEQSKNNSRSLDLLESRLLGKVKKSK